MLVHVVLFKPRADVSEAQLRAILSAAQRAASEIPEVRRCQVGRRVTHGAGYERLMPLDLPYAFITAFDDLAGLRAYLAHPAHEALGRFFGEGMDVGLAYDYEVREAAEGDALLGV